MDAAVKVTSLTSVQGSWVLHATTNGYFDVSPRVEEATIEFSQITAERTRFLARLRVGRRWHAIKARARTELEGRDSFDWRGFGAWHWVARKRWTLLLSTDGSVVVARCGASMVAEPGAIVFARTGVTARHVRDLLGAAPGTFGLETGEFATMSWRAHPAPITAR